MGTTLPRVWRASAHVLAVGLMAAAAHSWPVNEGVRAAAASRASAAAGTPVSIGRLRYNLASLTLDLDDVAVADAGGAAPRAFARRVAVAVSWRALLGGRLQVEHAAAHDVDLSVSARDGAVTADLRGLSIQMEESGAGGVQARVRLDGPGTLRIGPAAGEVTDIDGAFAFDGAALEIEQLRLAGTGLDVDLAGRVEDVRANDPHATIQGTWRADAGTLCATWLAGRARCDVMDSGPLHGTLTIGGLLTDPVLRIGGATSLRRDAGQSLAPLLAVDGEAIVSSRAFEVPRLEAAVFGGTAFVRGAVLVGEASRMSGAMVEWRGIDVRALLTTAGVDAPVDLVSDGSAVLTGDLFAPATLGVSGRT